MSYFSRVFLFLSFLTNMPKKMDPLRRLMRPHINRFLDFYFLEKMASRLAAMGRLAHRQNKDLTIFAGERPGEGNAVEYIPTSEMPSFIAEYRELKRHYREKTRESYTRMRWLHHQRRQVPYVWKRRVLAGLRANYRLWRARRRRTR